MASFGFAILAGTGMIFAVLVLLFLSLFKPVTILAALLLSLSAPSSGCWSAALNWACRR